MGEYKKLTYGSSDVKCPFYFDSTEKKTTIACEGFAQGMSERLIFRSIAAKQHHMGIYCISKYRECPMYKCIMSTKYKEG